MAKITLLRIRHIALSTLLEPINMKKILLLCLLLSVCVAGFSKETPEGVVSLASQRKMEKKLSSLPVFTGLASTKTSYDWLVHPERSHAGIYASSDGKSLIIANGMLWRTFRLFPNLATTDYVNRMTGERMLRAVSPEGTITLNGKQCSIGGLAGQPERGYLLPQWIDSMRTIPGSFVLEDFEIRDMQPTVSWHPVRWALNTEQASGKEVMFTLRGTGNFEDVTVRLHLGVYDHLPVIRKGLEIVNGGATAIRIDSLQLEYLSFAEPESLSGGDPSTFLLPNVHVESDYACGGSFTEKETDITEHWVEDPAYTSQRNYSMKTRCILDVSPRIGPAQSVAPGSTFSSFHVYEMPFDSYDRERKGLFTRHFYRDIAPWTTQNPIFLHLTSTKPEDVYRAVDQCAATGYEMIIFSFGSGLNAEDVSKKNIAKYKKFVDYARKRGIEMGCYSLLASRSVADSVDVVDPKTGRTDGARFGHSPCLSTTWGHDYFAKLEKFLAETGITCLEHDGSYPGDVCASTRHAFHQGLADSQWSQFEEITSFYHRLCSKGIYLNVPDFYFLNGSTKVSIGYREDNWSLPRDRQMIHTRQLNYDCTWNRIPSSLWSFVPLVQYHGGGAAATMEPLSEHLYQYRMQMVQNYGAGVQACYRGPRLYDTEETKKVVCDVIAWYKKYRTILNSDIIHLRKPDAQDWDGIMHVNPYCREKALALFFNPTDKEMVRTITLPLYYTGLEGKASIREREGSPVAYALDCDKNVTLQVKIPAGEYTWYVVE